MQTSASPPPPPRAQRNVPALLSRATKTSPLAPLVREMAPNQAGAGCVCAPNTTAACYTGPANTQSVGQCTDGLKTCAADGKGYLACAGDVLPGTEDCSNSVDEDCNGTYCTQAIWSKDFGDAASQTVGGMAMDASGNLFIIGISFYMGLSLPHSVKVQYRFDLKSP